MAPEKVSFGGDIQADDVYLANKENMRNVHIAFFVFNFYFYQCNSKSLFYAKPLFGDLGYMENEDVIYICHLKI